MPSSQFSRLVIDMKGGNAAELFGEEILFGFSFNR